MMALMKYRPPCDPSIIIARALEMLRMSHADYEHVEALPEDVDVTRANKNAAQSSPREAGKGNEDDVVCMCGINQTCLHQNDSETLPPSLSLQNKNKNNNTYITYIMKVKNRLVELEGVTWPCPLG